MENIKKSITDTFIKITHRFEQIITIVLSTIVGGIIVIALVRILENFVNLFIRDFFKPENITFEDYQLLFGKIMTLLISLEFMTSILKVMKTHEIKTLVQDVVLITALAIARKLIILDYKNNEPLSILVLGGLLVSIGIFYYLIKYEKK